MSIRGFSQYKIFYLLLTCICLFLNVSLCAAGNVVDEEPGVNPYREYHSGSGEGRVDTYTGALKIHQVDMIIPGNGGLDIKIQRIHDQSAGTFDTGLGDASWTLHFGRLFGNSSEIGNQFCGSPQIEDTADRPKLELPDGTIQQFAKAPIGSEYLYISKQRWIAKCANLDKGGLIIYSPEGTRYDMTVWELRGGISAWNVSKITDRNGNWLSFSYTPHSNPTPIYRYTPIYLQEITSSDGRVVTFTYINEPVPPSLNIGDKPKLLESISSNGQTWLYKYKYYYDLFNRYTNAKLENVILPDGRFWTFSYPDIKKFNITYGGYLQKIKNPLGLETIYQYDFFYARPNTYEFRIKSKETYDNNNLIGSWNYSYDLNGFSDFKNIGYDVTTVNGSDGTEIYKYTTTHNLSYITGNVWMVGLLLESMKCKISCQSNLLGNDSYTEQYTWESQKISSDHVSKSNYAYTGVSNDLAVYAPILTKKTVNSPNGTLVTSYSGYDSFGNPNSISETGQASRTKNITYYNDTYKWIIGLPDKEVTQNNWSIDRDFDVNGNVITYSKYGITEKRTYYPSGDLQTVTDANGNQTIYSNYYRGIAQRVDKPENITLTTAVNPTGTIRSATDGNNYTTSYSYDSMNRITGITPPSGNSISIQWNAGLSGNEKLLRTGNYEERTIFNSLGLIDEIIKRDISTGKLIRVAFLYDMVGNKIFESNPTEDQYALVNSLLGTHMEYDKVGNIIRLIHSDGKSKTFKYLSENNVELTNEEGKKYIYSYRSFGNPSKKELMNIAAPLAAASVSIKRDTLGHITDVVQNGVARQWAYYLGMELIKSSSAPDSGPYNYTYYPNGILKTKSRETYVTSYSYDKHNRPQVISYSDGTTPSTYFSYDKNDKIKSVANGTVLNGYGYDENGNLKYESVSTDGIVLSIGYEYNANGDLAIINYPDPDNQKVELFPDAFGRPTKLYPLASINGYHPNNVIKDIFYANNTFILTTLDQRQRPTTSVIKNTAGKIFLNTALDYDGTGNIKSITDPQYSMFNRVFGYDDIDRLVTVNGPWGNNGTWSKGSIIYDGGGNITSQIYGASTLNYVYNSNNMLQSVSGAKPYTFSYDIFGNVSNNGHNMFKYDMASNLRCIDCNLTSATNFLYGANNMRVKKDKNGISTFYLYAKNGNLMVEYTPKNAELKQYAYAGNKQIAMRRLWRMNLDLDKDGIADAKKINQVPSTNIASAENLTFYYTDLMGSPIAASSHPDGTMIWQEHYKPYGERQARSLFTGVSNTWFAGKQEDTDSGLSYFGARYYDPVIGRFMGVDPVESDPNNIHSLNRYAYANNNPYKYIDPSGKYSVNIFDGDVPHFIDLPGPPEQPQEIGFFDNVDLLGGLEALPIGGASIKLGGVFGGVLSKVGIPITNGLAGLSKSQVKTVLMSAQEAYKGSTRVGHALSKHAGRNPEIWGKITGSMKTWNDQAMNHVREIMREPGEFNNITTDEGITFVEKRLGDGRGIRLNQNYTFKGLVN